MSYLIQIFFHMFNLIWVDQYNAGEIVKLFNLTQKNDIIHYPESRHGWLQSSW